MSRGHFSHKTGDKIERLIVKNTKCPICFQRLEHFSKNYSWKDCVCPNNHSFEIKSKALSMLSDPRFSQGDLNIYFKCGNPRGMGDVDGVIYYIYELDHRTEIKRNIIFGFLPRSQLNIWRGVRGSCAIVQNLKSLEYFQLWCPYSLRMFL